MPNQDQPRQPWQAHGQTIWQPHAGGDRRIADCDTEATAKLIAAAPALLAFAVEMVLEDEIQRACLEESSSHTDFLDRAAIKDLNDRIHHTQSIIDAATCRPGDTA